MIPVLVGLLIESGLSDTIPTRLTTMPYKILAHERLLLMKELEKVFKTLKLSTIILP